MPTLVVQAHPVEDSYSAALLERVVAHSPGALVRRLCQGDELSATDFRGASEFVAVYPTWWGSTPATLLDALVDVVGPWVDGDEPSTSSPLASVATLTVVTSHGSPRLINRLQGEPGLQLWKRTILPLCAPKATFDWKAVYNLDRATEADRLAFLAAI